LNKKCLSYSFLLKILIGILIGLIFSCEKEELNPPVAEIIPRTDTLHGEIRVDDYYWLRERDNPEVLNYLEAENQYTEAMMRHTRGLQKKLFKEMKKRIKETDVSVPYKIRDYRYYHRNEEGLQYPIYCRKKMNTDSSEETILDQNKLAEGHFYCKIGIFKISPNQKILAYSVDYDGSEIFTVRFKNMEHGKILEDSLQNNYYSLEWANDNKTVFYTTLDEAMRPHRMYRHKLGTDQKDDELVYYEEDEAFHLDLSKTKNQKYILLQSASETTTEVHYIQSNSPDEELTVIQPRQKNFEYYVENWGTDFYILTNYLAKNFQIVKAPVKNPGLKNWETVIAHDPKVLLNDISMFQFYMVIWERKNGLDQIRIRNMNDGSEHYVNFAEEVYSCWLGENPEFDTNSVRFKYSSLITPSSTFDYNMTTRERKLLKQQEVGGGYDPSEYRSERIFATTDDGTEIPISLVYKKGIKLDGQNPFLLYGYGAYGLTSDPDFSRERLCLLDRGFIYAIAHVRGGGEMGRQWYDEGKMLKKKNTFTDFIRCAEHLIAVGYTTPEKLVIQGGSAGGLLIGAVTNMRPELFKAVVAQVPFVDVLNTMSDATVPLTVIEYEEWGNPNDVEQHQYMKSYSPYDNVREKSYPNMLITAGLNDARVQYWEPAKWTAKLRALKTDSNKLLLRTEIGKGHFGASGRYDTLKEKAFDYAFILEVVGIKE